MKSLYLIKVGASVLDTPDIRDSFLQQFANLKSPKILVHGGGSIATELGKKMGIISQYENGRRVTDEATLDLVTMVYGGLINKQLVAKLQSLGCNALGLSGADANILPAQKRAISEIDYGWVGDIDIATLRTDWLAEQLSADICPVIAPLTHDREGHILNTNADSIAAALAISLSKHYAVQLLFGFEKAGVLRDIHDELSLINHLSYREFETMKANGSIYAGMIPKLENAFRCAAAGVQSVRIGKAEHIQLIIQQQEGTLIS